MRHIPWILIGMLALDVSCGGEDEPSRDPRPIVEDDRDDDDDERDRDDEDDEDDEHDEQDVEDRSRRRDDGGIIRTDDSGSTRGDSGLDPIREDVCEVSDDASACQQCIGGECCAELARCTDDAECSTLLRCVAACKTGDSACVTTCRSDHPRGIAPMEAAFSCMQTNCDSVCR